MNINNKQTILITDDSETNINKLTSMINTQTELINELLSIGISLTSEDNYSLLLEKIMLGCKKFSNADAGTLYLISDDEKYLDFKIVHTDSLNIKMGGSGKKLKDCCIVIKI